MSGSIGGERKQPQIKDVRRVYRGVVSKATKVHALHQRVAIKVIQVPPATSSGQSAAYKKRILKEVKLHKMLTHRNILRLLDYSEHEGESVWIVLEYADGGDLFDKISGCRYELYLESYQCYKTEMFYHSSGSRNNRTASASLLLPVDCSPSKADRIPQSIGVRRS